MEAIVEVLTTIYYFYLNSPKRLRGLKQIGEIMDEQVKKPEKAGGTRWVDHKRRAVTKMIDGWASIIGNLEDFVENPDAGKKADQAKIKGLLTKMKEYKFVNHMHFMQMY
jgi:hypothetical protein